MIQLPSDFYIDEKTNYFGFLPLKNRFGWNNTPLHFGVKIYEWDKINGHNFVCGKKILEDDKSPSPNITHTPLMTSKDGYN